jgi:hypothetical protein
LAALGKMHRYNDLPWNAAHGAIQGPLQGLLRRHGRPPRKAAALSLTMLRNLLATCDRTARGRRDCALLQTNGWVGSIPAMPGERIERERYRRRPPSPSFPLRCTSTRWKDSNQHPKTLSIVAM